jgi:hypothetical protein
MPGAWAILGAFAFGTSAYSKLTDWPGGRIVGMHGTPGRVSLATRSRTAACEWTTATSSSSAAASRSDAGQDRPLRGEAP